LTDPAAIRDAIDGMARELAGWLERKGRFARTITIKVRYSDFTTISRSITARAATRDPDLVAAHAVGLLDRTEAGRRPVRLLGVSLHGIVESEREPPVATDPDLPLLPFDLV
ncbi:MAG TPA: DNA polymerase IV, partial [Methylomirabilota bacterium]